MLSTFSSIPYRFKKYVLKTLNKAVLLSNLSGNVQGTTKTAVTDDKTSVELGLLQFLRSYVSF